MSVLSEVQRILDNTTTIRNHLNSLGVQGHNLRDIAENVDVLVKPDIAGILGNFAEIESTDTASKKIDKGRCVVYNGLLYKAKSDIQQGNTLVVDGNIERTTVGDEISSINNDLVDSQPKLRVTASGSTYGEQLNSLASHISTVHSLNVLKRSMAFINFGNTTILRLGVSNQNSLRFYTLHSSASDASDDIIDIFTIIPNGSRFVRKVFKDTSFSTTDLSGNTFTGHIGLWY